MNPPQGKLKTSRRDFAKVAHDMRHVVYSVIRQRPTVVNNQQGFMSAARGTGFFVSPEIFVTCHHVVDDAADPHQAGDHYHLVANMGANTQPRVVIIQNPQVGQELNFFPQFDLAVLRVPREQNRAYAPLSFTHIYGGEDIGVAGYPIARLSAVNGRLSADGLIYRVGRGPVSASYIVNISAVMPQIPLVEVGFLFVPGNSGGPVFLAETAQVIGFVRGFHDTKIREKVISTLANTALPQGMSNQYVEHLHAIYSIAIKLDIVRATLQDFGVGL
jgi:S1-C subfamily serine protease